MFAPLTAAWAAHPHLSGHVCKAECRQWKLSRWDWGTLCPYRYLRLYVRGCSPLCARWVLTTQGCMKGRTQHCSAEPSVRTTGTERPHLPSERPTTPARPGTGRRAARPQHRGCDLCLSATRTLTGAAGTDGRGQEGQIAASALRNAVRREPRAAPRPTRSSRRVRARAAGSPALGAAPQRHTRAVTVSRAPPRRPRRRPRPSRAARDGRVAKAPRQARRRTGEPRTIGISPRKLRDDRRTANPAARGTAAPGGPRPPPCPAPGRPRAPHAAPRRQGHAPAAAPGPRAGTAPPGTYRGHPRGCGHGAPGAPPTPQRPQSPTDRNRRRAAARYRPAPGRRPPPHLARR